jgi:hypothetical protein
MRGRLDRITRADSTTVDMVFDAATNAPTFR